jgi:sulfonate transport system ATP-binding protein
MIRLVNVILTLHDNKVVEELVRIPCLYIAPGKNIGITGASGIGKTALLTTLCRPKLQRRAEKTALRLKGEATITFKKVVYVSQHDVLFPASTVRTNIFHLTNSKDLDLIEKFVPFEFVNAFKKSWKKSPLVLSGGERKALVIARSLLRNPDCIILDEPFSSLDIDNRRLISKSIRDYSNETNSTVIVVSHQIEDFIFLASRLAVLTGHHPAELRHIINIEEILKQTEGEDNCQSVLLSKLSTIKKEE